MNFRNILPPTVMVKGVLSSLLLVALISAAAYSIADPVFIGKFNGAEYFFDDSKIDRRGDLEITWVITQSSKFNITHDSRYAGAESQYAISCVNHKFSILGVATFAENGTPIAYAYAKDNMISFTVIDEKTIPSALYRELCIFRPTV